MLRSGDLTDQVCSALVQFFWWNYFLLEMMLPSVEQENSFLDMSASVFFSGFEAFNFQTYSNTGILIAQQCASVQVSETTA